MIHLAAVSTDMSTFSRVALQIDVTLAAKQLRERNRERERETERGGGGE